jgi:hypothetical protein
MLNKKQKLLNDKEGKKRAKVFDQITEFVKLMLKKEKMSYPPILRRNWPIGETGSHS